MDNDPAGTKGIERQSETLTWLIIYDDGEEDYNRTLAAYFKTLVYFDTHRQFVMETLLQRYRFKYINNLIFSQYHELLLLKSTRSTTLPTLTYIVMNIKISDWNRTKSCGFQNRISHLRQYPSMA